MSENSEKMRAVRKRRTEHSYQLPDYRFRVQTAYRIPLVLRRALERLKNKTSKTLSDLMTEAIIAKCKAEGVQIKICDKIEGKRKNMVYCKLHKREIKVDDCIKCLVPFAPLSSSSI